MVTARRLFVSTLLALLISAPLALAGACPGDTNGDNAVDFSDLNAVLSSFNQSIDPPGSGPDVTGDGSVTFADLNIVVSSFNMVCAFDFDAQVVAIDHPGTALGGQSVAITVTVRHNAPEATDVPVMLMLGIATSLFTGIFCSRVALDWLVRVVKVERLRVG